MERALRVANEDKAHLVRELERVRTAHEAEEKHRRGMHRANL